MESDIDPAKIRSNSFRMTWPPKSGRQMDFPEVDNAGWFDMAEAEKMILPGQVGLLSQLEQKLQELALW